MRSNRKEAHMQDFFAAVAAGFSLYAAMLVRAECEDTQRRARNDLLNR